MYETKFLKAIENIKKEDLDKTHSLLKNNESKAFNESKISDYYDLAAKYAIDNNYFNSKKLKDILLKYGHIPYLYKDELIKIYSMENENFNTNSYQPFEDLFKNK